MLRLMSFARSSASQSRFIRGTVSLFPRNTRARNNSSDNNKFSQKPEVEPKDSVTKSNPEKGTSFPGSTTICRSEDVVSKQSLGDAPPLDLGKWNNEPYIQSKNNCYNYGRDIITNTFAQPGSGSGHPFHEITAAAVQQAAECDGVTLLPCQPHPCEPCPTHADVPHGQSLVALVVDPDNDYHWYRLDSNKYWSHKPSWSPATNLDGNGNHIPDPRYAANSPNGPDYRFVAFMTTNRNVIA